MKELTIEEKAKAYDEAIERARNLYNSEETSAEVEIACENIFPELIESEDERIKRLLHSIASKMSFHLHDIFTDEEFQWFDAWANAWLEKQGEQKPAWSEEDEKMLNNIDITLFEEKSIPNVKYWKFMNWLKSLKERTFTKKDVDDAYIKGVCDAKQELEKQGTPKEITVTYEAEVGNGNTKGLITERIQLPKFKIGDWITNGLSYPMQISSIEDDIYYTHNDTVGGDIESMDKEYHLWTIQEAKDGDVLISQYNNPFIYNGELDYCTIGAYCGLTVGDFFDIASKTNPWTDKVGVHPSTKEQRDHLFQKMKEAGFEWDAENKKLNKIEPKFHEGEWVVDKYGHVTKIMRVNNNFNYITYDCCPIEENSRDWASYSENDIRLWDISDAKDGDVLVASDNSIFIFSHCIDNACVHHIALEVEDGTMDINYKLERGWETIRGVCPATQEQRDLLFQKLKDADYEWDSIKKKLKRID